MTNKELQDLLKQYPDDEEVVIAQYHDYHDTIERVLEAIVTTFPIQINREK